MKVKKLEFKTSFPRLNILSIQRSSCFRYPLTSLPRRDLYSQLTVSISWAGFVVGWGLLLGLECVWMRHLIGAMKSVIQRFLQGAGSTAAVLAAICLAGCDQGGHDHDSDHEHPHAHQDGEGREHHGAEDSDANGPTGAVAEGDLAAQRAAYPLKVCLVEGDEELGSMGEPAEYVHEGRLVMFCCKSCIEAFQTDPAKYLAQLDKAASSSSGVTTEE